MTRETKIALLVGLMFIICFGIILGGARNGPAGSAPEPIPVALGTDELPALAAREVVRPALPAAPAAPHRLPVFRLPGAVSTQRPATPPTLEATETTGREAPAPAAAPPRVRTYIVASGDTLWTIAGKAYGAGNERFNHLIAEANRDVLPNPDELRIGLKLRIPPLPSAADRTADGERLRDRLRHLAEATGKSVKPAATKARRQPTTYTVKSGDTLTAIARRTLGSSSAANVEKLYRANRDKLSSPDNVPLGIVLRIPG